LAKSKASVPAYISNKGNEKAAVNHREEQHNTKNRANIRFFHDHGFLCASIAPIMAALDTDAAFIIWHSKIITSSRARPAAGLYRHSA